MECPKCGGGAFLSEEELVQILEQMDPMKVVSKMIYVCRACSEKFSRLMCENLEAKRKISPDSAPEPSTATQETNPAEGLKFF